MMDQDEELFIMGVATIASGIASRANRNPDLIAEEAAQIMKMILKECEKGKKKP